MALSSDRKENLLEKLDPATWEHEFNQDEWEAIVTEREEYVEGFEDGLERAQAIVKEYLEISYEKAWKEFLERFSGAHDGVAQAVERGSSKAVSDEKIYDDIERIIEEVAEKHGIEDSVFDLNN